MSRTPASGRDEGDPDGGRPAESAYLTCGRPVDALLEQVAEGRAGERDAHQLGCTHCQAALAEYDRLWSPLRALAAETVTAPEGFVDDALARIRGAIERPDYATIASDTGRGVTRIAARVVVVAARQSAQRVPGVRVALGTHLDPTRARAAGRGADAAGGAPPEPAGTTVDAGVAGSSTAIQITLAADYGIDLRALGERVRETVIARVRELTDLEPVQVTVIIDDVLP